MKSMIVYYTKSGHTKQIAESMANVLHVPAISVMENPKTEEVDVLFLGSGIYAGKVGPEMEEYINGLEKEHAKKVVLFSTSLSSTPQMAKVREALQNKGINVDSGEFNCKGKFLFFSRKHPDINDLNAAAKFAEKYL